MPGRHFTVDMESMDVAHVPVMKERAQNPFDHLKSADIFDVPRFPETTLEFLTNDCIEISGDLIIRDLTRRILFYARQKENVLTTGFTFNRLDWSIASKKAGQPERSSIRDVELGIGIVLE